ncbi:MAG: energy-coupling factor transporter transmembrane component T [Clostridia bacterium]
MLKDITIGQYFPGNSLVHKLDPRVKISLTVLYIVALFLLSGAISYVLATLFVVAVIKNSKISAKLIIKSLKPLIFIIAFTSILNIFYTDGTPLVQIGFLKVTYEGLTLAFFMVWRIILLIAGSSLLTYTTSPILLTDGIEHLLSPFKKFKFPVHEFSMMMTIALRFIPTLIDETEKIINAQKARGADFESGNLVKRAKALVPILIPLFISSFRRADELAVAMECRLYQGGEGRTRLRVLKFEKSDYYTSIGSIIFFVIMVII